MSRPLEGSAVVFAPDALRFRQTAASAVHADGFVLTPLCSVGTEVLAMAAEKGAVLKNDLAIRPARVVVIGDPSFLLNGSLASRANANRDFFLNCVAYLSGTDAAVASGAETNVLSTGLDRAARGRFAAVVAGAVPLVVLLLLMAVAAGRRRRG